MAAKVRYLVAALAAFALVLLPAQAGNTPGIVITDGSNTVNATHLSVTGGTVGGTAPNATLSVTGGGGGSGTVNNGVAGQVGSYLTTGTAVSGGWPNTPGFANVLNYGASGLNTTGIGSCTSGTNVLTTTFILNGLSNGMSIAVTGAGSSGANLVTTISSGAGSTSLHLGTNCLTTVSAASGTGTVSTNSLATGSPVTGLSNNQTISILYAGAGGVTVYNTTVASGEGTSTLILAHNVTTAASGAPFFSTGATVYTVGTIASGSTSLAVISTAGWVAGEGIVVKAAGNAGGTTNLTTTVASIPDSTHLTLTAGSSNSGTLTNTQIDHDDTAAINAALATTGNVEFPTGQFNITSTLTLAYPQWLKCAGAGVGLTAGYSGNAAPVGGTVIWNRGTANNIINMTSQQSHLSDCGIVQAEDVPPTAGFCIRAGSGSATLLNSGWIERNKCYNTYEQLDIDQGLVNWEIAFNVFDAGEFMGNAAQEIYNNPPNAGDNKILGNNFGEQVLNGVIGLSITAGDTSFWVNDKWTGCTPCISATSGSIDNQHFNATGIESGSATGIAISVGVGWSFMDTEFLLSGQSGFVISGNAAYGIILGTNATTSCGACTPYTNTSSNASTWFHPANTNNPTF